MSSTIITTRGRPYHVGFHRVLVGHAVETLVIYELGIRDHLCEMERDGVEGGKRRIMRKRERDISLPGRRRYGIPLDINRASCTKGGPLLSGHFIGAPGTI